MMRRPSAILLLVTTGLLVSCSSHESPSDPAASSRTAIARSADERRGGALDAARRFVEALNVLDPEGAAACIAWDLWVAEDARVKALLQALRTKSLSSPPTPQELAAPALPGSSVTLREVLGSPDAPALVARIARERFIASIREDFAADRRKMDAKLVSWHLDRIERSATLWMPNGKQVQMLMFRREGAWKLVPRW